MADEIGLRVRAWRERQEPKKITQTQFAELIGVDQTTLSQFEAGQYFLNEERALKIEQVTGGEIQGEDCVREDRRRFVAVLRAAAESELRPSIPPGIVAAELPSVPANNEEGAA